MRLNTITMAGIFSIGFASFASAAPVLPDLVTSAGIDTDMSGSYADPFNLSIYGSDIVNLSIRGYADAVATGNYGLGATPSQSVAASNPYTNFGASFVSPYPGRSVYGDHPDAGSPDRQAFEPDGHDLNLEANTLYQIFIIR